MELANAIIEEDEEDELPSSRTEATIEAQCSYVFEDQSTHELREIEPLHVYSEAEERDQVMLLRKQLYQQEQTQVEQAKRQASAICLQCAWRSKRARDTFRQVLLLRAKEKERDQLVQQLHQKTEKTRKAHKKRFFSFWKSN